MSKKEKIYHGLCLLLSAFVAAVLVYWILKWRSGADPVAPMITSALGVLLLAILIPTIVALARRGITLVGTILQIAFLFLFFPYGLPVAILGVIVLRADLKRQKNANQASDTARKLADPQR